VTRELDLRPEKVWIVGAGPGDPELLTVRAARLIAEADDLLVDALVPPAVYQGVKARILYVGKRSGRPHLSQREIEDILVRLAREGRRVVRLKGGDPAVFARLGEEVRALEGAGVPWEAVPGVSSFLAAAQAVGIPLTDRGEADRFVVLTGHGGEGRSLPSLPAFDAATTVVLLMAIGNLGELVAAALDAGYPAELPAVAVSQASLPGERRVAAPLEALPRAVASARLETPATVLIGQVAKRLTQTNPHSEVVPFSVELRSATLS